MGDNVIIPAFVKEFYQRELAHWDLAAKNGENISQVVVKPFTIGQLKGFVQYNPARKISTSASLDKESLKNRKCFLCSGNRQKEQNYLDILPDWELLVNPYPILPYHFTIAHKSHIPQDPDLVTGLRLASLLPGMVVFFNDNGAGASAPDHRHYQAVPHQCLPLFKDGIPNFRLPYQYISGFIKDIKEIQNMDLKEIPRPSNIYFYYSGECIFYMIVPRKAHRPSHYFKPEPHRRMVSPGGIDIAGVVVIPEERDFKRITDDELQVIFSEVVFPC